MINSEPQNTGQLQEKPQSIWDLASRLLAKGRQFINRILGKDAKIRASIQKELSDILQIELNFQGNQGDYERTLLHYAAQCGRVDMVRKLVALGEKCNAQDSHGLTPLHYAAINDHENVVRALVGLGADNELKEKYGYTPLYYAAIRGNEDVVHAMIELGANVQAQSKQEETVLHVAANNFSLIYLFIRLGVNPNTPNNLGELPSLGLAPALGKRERVRLIVTALLENEINDAVERRVALMSEAEINRALDPQSYEQFCADVCCIDWISKPDSRVRSLTWMSSKDMVKHHPQRCTNLLADWNEPMSRAVEFQKAANAKKAAQRL